MNTNYIKFNETDNSKVYNLLNANGIEYKKPAYRIKVRYDECPGNPIAEWCEMYPMLVEYNERHSWNRIEYAEFDMDKYILDLLMTNEDMIKHFDVIKKHLGYNDNDLSILKYDDDDEYLYEQNEYISNIRYYYHSEASLNELSELLTELGVKNYLNDSKGYSQSDYFQALIIAPDNVIKEFGIATEHVQKDMEKQFELYEYYAWGDVYGYEVVNEFGEVMDSCFGFYGKIWQDNDVIEQMVDNIDGSEYGWNDEQILTELHNAVERGIEA